MIISHLPQIVRDKNLSLAELSRRTGLTPKTIVKLYYADFTQIHILALDKLCEILETSPGEIFQYKPGDTLPYPVLAEQPSRTHPRNKRALRAAYTTPTREHCRRKKKEHTD